MKKGEDDGNRMNDLLVGISKFLYFNQSADDENSSEDKSPLMQRKWELYPNYFYSY